MKYIYLSIITLILVVLKQVSAQNNSHCENNLITANKNYDAGHFSQCLKLLNPCVNKLNRDLRFEAYRLMAMCHIQLIDNNKAEADVVNLLKTKPDYKNFPYVDPVEFTKMLDKYDVWAMFEFGMKAGININSVNPVKNYSLTNSPATFNPKAGFQTGIFAEYFPMKIFSVTAELLYEGLNYSRTAGDVSGWKQEYVENLNYFSIPVAARYYFYDWKELQFGVEAGMQTQFLNATSSNITLHNNVTGEVVQNTIVQEKQRSKHLYSLLFGMIVKYKLGSGNLAFNARYSYGLNNVVNTENRYENLNFILANQYVDSDIRFNPMYFSMSYQFPVQGLNTVKKVK